MISSIDDDGFRVILFFFFTTTTSPFCPLTAYQKDIITARRMSSGNGPTWEWLDDSGWSPYQSADEAAIEAAYAAGYEHIGKVDGSIFFFFCWSFVGPNALFVAPNRPLPQSGGWRGSVLFDRLRFYVVEPVLERFFFFFFFFFHLPLLPSSRA